MTSASEAPAASSRSMARRWSRWRRWTGISSWTASRISSAGRRIRRPRTDRSRPGSRRRPPPPTPRRPSPPVRRAGAGVGSADVTTQDGRAGDRCAGRFGQRSQPTTQDVSDTFRDLGRQPNRQHVLLEITQQLMEEERVARRPCRELGDDIVGGGTPVWVSIMAATPARSRGGSTIRRAMPWTLPSPSRSSRGWWRLPSGSRKQTITRRLPRARTTRCRSIAEAGSSSRSASSITSSTGPPLSGPPTATPPHGGAPAA